MLKDKQKKPESEDISEHSHSIKPNAADPPESPESDSLNLLIERAKAGDNDAFSDIVEEFERFVYNTACRILSASGSSLEAAEDIAQISFIKAWRNLSAFRGDCSFSTWLFRITANTARDSIRTAARRSAVSLTKSPDGSDDGEEWDVPVTSGDEIPEDSLLKKEQIIGIRRAIEALPSEQRQVVIMRDIHELSYSTIAETLGLELGTVKSRINRGRANLKALLESGKFI